MLAEGGREVGRAVVIIKDEGHVAESSHVPRVGQCEIVINIPHTDSGPMVRCQHK